MSDDFFFDPGTQEGSSFELIPPGDYVAEIIEAEIRQPKSGDGHMLALTWKICQGDSKAARSGRRCATSTAIPRPRTSLARN